MNPPASEPQVIHSNVRDSLIGPFLLLAGMYMPTSIGGVQSRLWVALSLLVAFAAFVLLAVMNGLSHLYRSHLFACLIVLTLVICTFTSPLTEVEFGGVFVYCLMALMFVLKVNGISCGPLGKRVFLVVNVTNVMLGIGIIAQFEPVLTFLRTYYTYFYPELLPMMFVLRKPVLAFATHSVAGFFYFIFFWANLRSYETSRKSLYLAFAIIYSAFSLFLFSFSSLFFLFWEAALLLNLAWQRSRVLSLAGIAAGAGCALAVWSWLGDWKADLIDYSTSVLTSTGNGLLGRYSSSTGDLVTNLQFIRNHPFTPVGLTGYSRFLFVDSGPIEYFLRGSLPLVVSIYGGLFCFLKFNLKHKKDVWVLFAAIMSFEIGFSVLGYPRTFYLLPFFILYLNGLERAQPLGAALQQEGAQ